MPVDIVKYRKWVLEIDKTLTSELYQGIILSGTEICGCGQCKEFLAIKEKIYPQEIRDLFIKLGIDIYKEFELCDYGGEDEGHIYSWWFHFVGKIIEGQDSSVPLPQGGSTLELLKINEFFQVGFTKDISLSFFKERSDLIQVELWAEWPWDKSNLPNIN